MYKTLFIDLDDTIWDTRTNGKESMEEVYRDYQFDRFYPTFDAFYRVYFPHNLHLWSLYRDGKVSKKELIVERLLFPLRPFGIDDETFALDLNDDFLHRTSLKTKLMPYALETLDYLKPKYRLFILSNGFTEVQYKKINNSGLSTYFEEIILSDEIDINKPDIRFFSYALEKTQTRKEDTLMIGDSWEADIIGAKQAGIDQIWYKQDISLNQEFIPTYEISSLKELKDIL